MYSSYLLAVIKCNSDISMENISFNFTGEVWTDIYELTEVEEMSEITYILRM